MTITDVPGVRVGHWSDPEAQTGCTVLLLAPEGAVASVDVQGPAPGTRETDLLQPGMLVERIHAICLSGAGTSGASPVHFFMFPAAPVVHFGPEAMRRECLPRIAAGELLLAFGVIAAQAALPFPAAAWRSF